MTEPELMTSLLNSADYKEFRTELFQHKIDSEARAWAVLMQHQGHYTKEILNSIFDTVDGFPWGNAWFGPLLQMPLRNMIFETPVEQIAQWIDELLFKRNPLEKALQLCFKEMRIRGAVPGLASLFLYLSDGNKFNVWLPATEEGLIRLARIGKLKRRYLNQDYLLFNQAATALRNQWKLQPVEMDWVLWSAGRSDVSAGR
jgi:hypothetical protein